MIKLWTVTWKYGDEHEDVYCRDNFELFLSEAGARKFLDDKWEELAEPGYRGTARWPTYGDKNFEIEERLVSP
ncbi:MAG: hypothetical protein COA84_13135 [Robiginitomaculum sp.]|nr:MAG: hypothetical protein COA84_13135 [Robiginitomaculum sp.]